MITMEKKHSKPQGTKVGKKIHLQSGVKPSPDPQDPSSPQRPKSHPPGDPPPPPPQHLSEQSEEERGNFLPPPPTGEGGVAFLYKDEEGKMLSSHMGPGEPPARKRDDR